MEQLKGKILTLFDLGKESGLWSGLIQEYGKEKPIYVNSKILFNKGEGEDIILYGSRDSQNNLIAPETFFVDDIIEATRKITLNNLKSVEIISSRGNPTISSLRFIGQSLTDIETPDILQIKTATLGGLVSDPDMEWIKKHSIINSKNFNDNLFIVSPLLLSRSYNPQSFNLNNDNNNLSFMNPYFLKYLNSDTTFPLNHEKEIIIPYNPVVNTYNYWHSLASSSLFEPKELMSHQAYRRMNTLSEIAHAYVKNDKKMSNIEKQTFTDVFSILSYLDDKESTSKDVESFITARSVNFLNSESTPITAVACQQAMKIVPELQKKYNNKIPFDILLQTSAYITNKFTINNMNVKSKFIDTIEKINKNWKQASGKELKETLTECIHKYQKSKNKNVLLAIKNMDIINKNIDKYLFAPGDIIFNIKQIEKKHQSSISENINFLKDNHINVLLPYVIRNDIYHNMIKNNQIIKLPTPLEERFSFIPAIHTISEGFKNIKIKTKDLLNSSGISVAYNDNELMIKHNQKIIEKESSYINKNKRRIYQDIRRDRTVNTVYDIPKVIPNGEFYINNNSLKNRIQQMFGAMSNEALLAKQLLKETTISKDDVKKLNEYRSIASKIALSILVDKDNNKRFDKLTNSLPLSKTFMEEASRWKPLSFDQLQNNELKEKLLKRSDVVENSTLYMTKDISFFANNAHIRFLKQEHDIDSHQLIIDGSYTNENIDWNRIHSFHNAEISNIVFKEHDLDDTILAGCTFMNCDFSHVRSHEPIDMTETFLSNCTGLNPQYFDLSHAFIDERIEKDNLTREKSTPTISKENNGMNI